MNYFLAFALCLLSCFPALSDQLKFKSTQKDKVHPNEQYIVTLEAPSFYQQLKMNQKTNQRIKNKSHIKQVKANIVSQQKVLIGDIQNKFKGKVSVNKQFDKLINAVVISASPSQIHKISSMSSVKRVNRVIQHKITSASNVTNIDLIKADQVWSIEKNGEKITGKNISVGVLDTGIDYTHPDLGGCFGAGCKVYGGYDFIEGDNDPFDNESHGTHVAGIIAANGELKGVAPDARLLAVKVCDDFGICDNSHVIAGLEYALDPDGDPATADSVNIINMSLGSIQHDEALIEAVNSAVEQGVVVVVSAGNDGSTHNVIGSPADAEKAITVAASVDNQNIADFSSRGLPSSGIAILKPEIAAPGVSINSTLPHGEYGELSGTSMASPMVAGVIALMKQYSPHQTPAQIKASLVSTASPIVNDLLAEGSGLINALSAINLPIVIDTPIISFGDSDFSQYLYEVTAPLVISNPNSEEVSFPIHITESAHPSISYQSAKSSITLAAGETLSIDLSMSVNMNELPISQDSPVYQSAINFKISDKIYNVPIVFFHRSYININFINYPQNYSDLIILNEDETHIYDTQIWSPYSLSGQTKRVFVPPGNYKLIDSAKNSGTNPLRETTFLFYPDIVLENSYTIDVSVEQATTKLHFNVENFKGKKISGERGMSKDSQKGVSLSMFNKSTGKFIKNNFLSFELEAEQEATFSFNSIPDGYTFHLFSENNNEQATEHHSFSYKFDSPITQEPYVEIKKDDYKKIKLNYAQPPLLTEPFLDAFVYSRWNINEPTEDSFGEYFSFNNIEQGRTYYSTGLGENFKYSYFNDRINNKEWHNEDHIKLYESPHFKLNEGKQLAIYNFYNDQVIKIFEPSEHYQLSVGKLLPFWSGTVSKLNNGKFVYNFTDTNSNAFFRDSHYSYWLDKVKIYTNNYEDIVSHNYAHLNLGAITQYITLPIQSGKVQTEISFNGYIIEDRTSNISTELTFDLNNEKFSPPVIRDLQIITANHLTHQLQCRKGSISIEFDETIVAENIQLFIKSSDNGEWQQPPIMVQDKNAIVNLSDILPGFYDLTFHVQNSEESSLSYTAEPAFHVSNSTLDTNDCDGDGVNNINDDFPFDPNESVDTDNDGIGNNADSDDDGDGVSDSTDAYPLDASRSDNSNTKNNNLPKSSDDSGGGSMYVLLLLIFTSRIVRLKNKYEDIYKSLTRKIRYI
ncbi:S8 family serine peptidase [Thalassotalea sp. 1_MG-2023]|uniref:S8 family peptidase n=1 Tax=Thalassotalea sp. 1_MG-2023 TaxID=3062680 RepID=UPI0026E163AC|nr:S8 family serine peptidase [Thalassotalea sp. 1_MG-2023]MDO6425916.1 S8 family serine peptidase [Thalassotalea sp. 1_MG-2023]